jgi:hypothetical protein
MSILCISVLNPCIVACLFEKKTQITSTFSSIDSFLKSEFWESHKKTPRIIYADNKESTHTLLNLTPLSWVEKKAIFLQKILRNDTPTLLLPQNQTITLDSTLPNFLIKGPVLKKTSTILELLKIALRKNKHPYSLLYFHQKNIGVWQIALHHQTLLFHHFTPEKKDVSLSDILEIGQRYFSQKGMNQSIHIIDLASFLKRKKDVSSSIFLSFNSIKTSALSKVFLSSHSLTIQLVLIIFLGVLLIHNKLSIELWERQAKVSKKNLESIQQKTKTPSHQRAMHHFKNRKDSHV